METAIVAFVFLGFAASIVSAVFGFGTALIVLAIGSHILPIKTTIVLATVLFAVSTITKSALFARHIDWKITGIMAFGSLPFAYLGALFLDDLPSETLRRLLGLMVLIYLAITLFKLLPKFRIGTGGLIAGSAIYGFISGLLGSGNVIKAIIFREISISKEAFVGAMAATSVLSNIAKLSAYYQSGLLASKLAWPVMCLALAAFSAALLGKYLLGKVTSNQFSYGVQIVLAISAIGLLV